MHNTSRSILALIVLILLGLGALYIQRNPITFNLSPHRSEENAMPPRPLSPSASTLSDNAKKGPTNAEATIDKLKQQLNVEEKANAPLRDKIKSLISTEIISQNTISKLREQVNGQRDRMKQISEKLDNATTEIEKRDQELVQLKSAAETASNAIAALKDQQTAMQTELESLKKELANAKAQQEKSKTDHAAQAAAAETELTRVRQELEATQKKLQQALASGPTPTTVIEPAAATGN